MLLYSTGAEAFQSPSVNSKKHIPGCRNHEQQILKTRNRFFAGPGRSTLPGPLPVKEDAHALPVFRGSLSIEAAMVLPLFLIVIIAAYSFMNLMAVEIAVDQALSETGEELAVYAGIASQLLGGSKGGNKESASSKGTGGTEAGGAEEGVQEPEGSWLGDTIAGFFGAEEGLGDYLKASILNAGFSEVVVQKLVTEKLKGSAAESGAVKGGLSGIRYTGSSIDEKSGRMVLSATYEIRLAYFPSFTGITLTQKSVHRIWNGKGSVSESTAEDMVYVTASGTVYHRTLDCPSLKLTIHAVSAEEILTLRNTSGHIFYPCERCHPTLTGTVYYTPYGESFHSDFDCSGLKRTIREVPLSEVGDLPACKRCGGGDE